MIEPEIAFADLDDLAVSARGLDHLPALPHVVGRRLLHEDVLARGEGGLDLGVVLVGGGGDDDGIHVGAAQDLGKALQDVHPGEDQQDDPADEHRQDQGADEQHQEAEEYGHAPLGHEVLEPVAGLVTKAGS